MFCLHYSQYCFQLDQHVIFHFLQFGTLTLEHKKVQMSKINNDTLAHTVNNNIIKCEH